MLKNLKYFFLLIFFFGQSVILGAIPNENTLSQNILRGGRPTTADVDRLKANGYKTIISLENDSQVIAAEKKYAQQLGLKFLSYPMNAWNKPNDQQINEILAQMGNTKNYPLFVHCQHGRDRTGLVSALFRVTQQNWKAQDAHEEMLALGFRQIFFNMENYFWKKTGATRPLQMNPKNSEHMPAGRNL